MSSETTLKTLFAGLSRGDGEAIEQAFVAYAPYLRVMVRRYLSPRLRAKLDSTDVVQSVWADLLTGLRARRWQFADAARLRHFLVKVTRNRVLNRLRRLRRETDLVTAEARCGEGPRQPGAPAAADEGAAAAELWEQLLALCPPAHHNLLRLRRQGATLREVAAQTGLHESSVRRVLYELARRFALRTP
jgi:RNA polymerase sigma factor (sigma-70 family)